MTDSQIYKSFFNQATKNFKLNMIKTFYIIEKVRSK